MLETNSRKDYALKVIDHVAYEIKMFLFCIDELLKKQIQDNHYNALVESFVLHFRNLFEFFNNNQNPRYKGNDNTVFYADITGSSLNLDVIYDDYARASKKIAHIDRNRTTLKEVSWPFLKLYCVFRSPILNFINDQEILPHITEIDLVSEIKRHCNSIDCILNNSARLGLEINRVDTTCGSVSVTSSTIQGK